MYYRTQERVNEKSLIKIVSNEQFERDFVKNKDISECFIEIFKDECEACHYNRRMFDVLAQKFKKHDL